MNSSTQRLTRRRCLAVIAAIGSAVAAGCSGDTPNGTAPSQDSTSEPNQSTKNNSDPTVLENPESSLSDVVSPGKVTYADDPNWRMHGHDTGNSFVNPQVNGPSGDPSVQWTFDRDIFPTGSLSQHQPLIVDETVYTCQFNIPDMDHGPVKPGRLR
jgi:hypothetical protein